MIPPLLPPDTTRDMSGDTATALTLELWQQNVRTSPGNAAARSATRSTAQPSDGPGNKPHGSRPPTAAGPTFQAAPSHRHHAPPPPRGEGGGGATMQM